MASYSTMTQGSNEQVETFSCAICQDDYAVHDMVQTRCQPVAHKFCNDCFTLYINITQTDNLEMEQGNVNCPMCRQHLRVSLRRKFFPPEDHTITPACVCSVCTLLRARGLAVPQPMFPRGYFPWENDDEPDSDADRFEDNPDIVNYETDITTEDEETEAQEN